ncbi:class I SAM-dependent methyltransferase [candidate division KSB1 bacterium]|nr:class I SAM-dependent methyltransferase [candidate division KSB1 bacterium]
MNDTEIRTYFNHVAAEWRDKPLADDQAQLLTRLLPRLPIRAGHWLLDLGCGTGRCFQPISQWIPSGLNYVALDFAAAMLRAFDHRHSPDVHRICGKGQQLPFQNHAFDVILGMGLLPHLSDKRQTLAECQRVLKPGGSLILLHLMGRERLNALHASLGGVVQSHQLMTMSELQRLMASVGFEVALSEDQTTHYLSVGVKRGESGRLEPA